MPDAGRIDSILAWPKPDLMHALRQFLMQHHMSGNAEHDFIACRMHLPAFPGRREGEHRDQTALHAVSVMAIAIGHVPVNAAREPGLHHRLAAGAQMDRVFLQICRAHGYLPGCQTALSHEGSG